MNALALVGATGHFGSIVFRQLRTQLTDYQFILLGRRKPSCLSAANVHFMAYDFEEDSQLPSLDSFNVRLLVDFTGPCRLHDGITLRHALQAGYGYVDVALHNSHLEVCERVVTQFEEGFALVHTGIFPGFSNLMAKAAVNSAKPEARVILASTFPCYNGGGMNVAQSLYDMLCEAETHRFIQGGVNQPFIMAQTKTKLPFEGSNLSFLGWELPEIRCLKRSIQPQSLERWIRISPALINPWLKWTVLAFRRGWFAGWRGHLFRWLVFMGKSKLLAKVDAPFTMVARSLNQQDDVVVRLSTKRGLTLHGIITAEFICKLLQKPLPKGLFTPEQLFDISDILPIGDFPEYELSVHLPN